MNATYVHVLWCDDIRQEIGNKPSLMGVYTGGLLLPSLPTSLSRLSLQIYICTPLNWEPEKVAIEIYRDDAPAFIKLEPEVERGPEELAPPEGATQRQLQLSVILGPTEIPVGSKWFGVRAILDGQTFEGPKLRVSVDLKRFEAVLPPTPIPILAAVDHSKQPSD